MLQLLILTRVHGLFMRKPLPRALVIQRVGSNGHVVDGGQRGHLDRNVSAGRLVTTTRSPDYKEFAKSVPLRFP